MKKMHLICNAHIDPIWQWEWAEGMSAALSTFQSAVNLLHRFDYVFCHNESSLYKYTEKYAPALFSEIQSLVKQGKWRVMGGWYIQPDCLMANGETFIRQIREGEVFFDKKLSAKTKTAVCLDAFGHSRGLVQIIKKCGQENYLFVRPYNAYNGEQLKLPSEAFIWEGYDGSRVKAYRVTAYNTGLGMALEKIKKDVEFYKDYEVAASLWGVGNHGGGPSAKDLGDIAEFIKSTDIEVVHSDPDTFFDEINPTNVFNESLISCMPGCYSSMVGLKQQFRQLEKELFFVEKMRSVAALKGACPYPQEKISDVVEDLLNVQFHDVLPGTCIKAGEDNGLRFLGHGLKELEQIKIDAFFALCKGQRVAEEKTYPILVFNPKTYESEQLIECELSIIPTELYEEDFSQIEIYDENGVKLTSQTVKESSNQSIDWRKKVVFYGKLNPLGVTRFTAKTVEKPQVKHAINKDVTFDNGEKRVVISAESGLIESYQVGGVEYAKGQLFKPFIWQDNADPWAMSVEQRTAGVGESPIPMEKLTAPDGAFEGLQSFEIIEDGDVYLGVEAFFGVGLTRMRIGYKIYKQGTAVDIDVNLFPSEANRAIKLHVPVIGEGYLGEQVFGREDLYQDGRECVSQNFVAKRCGDKYLQIVTPSTYASSCSGNEIRFTLLRTATYCAHPAGERPLLKPNIFTQKIDQGQRDYSFRLQIAGESELTKLSQEFIEKPYAQNIFPTVDDSCDNGFEITTSCGEIHVVTIKKAVQKDGYIVRLYNGSESEGKTLLKCGNSQISLKFGKFEIKTVLYGDDGLIELAQAYI
ncbi:MAG: hypothetical protein IJY84_01185 [Clostridia bacterium]|nr:hypothetical protein [Clostridia bacterium]